MSDNRRAHVNNNRTQTQLVLLNGNTMFHRKQQRKIVNPLPRVICRWVVLPRVFPISPYEQRRRSLNHARTQTRAQIFRCRFNSACMADREFFRSLPFPLPFLFYPFPSLSNVHLRSLNTFSTSIRKKLLRIDPFAKIIAITTIERYHRTTEISIFLFQSYCSIGISHLILFGGINDISS